MTKERQKELWRRASNKYRASKHGSAVRNQYSQSMDGKKAVKRYKENRPQDKKQKEQDAHRLYRQTEKGRAVVIFCDARVRARKAKLPFTITKDWVVEHLQSGVCAQTGDAFDYTLLSSNGHRQPNMFAPSLDQIVPNAGYTEENTQIVCWWWNAFKYNRTDDEAWQHFTTLHRHRMPIPNNESSDTPFRQRV